MDGSHRLMVMVAIMGLSFSFLSFIPSKAKTPLIVSSGIAVAALILSYVGYVDTAKIVAIFAGIVFCVVVVLVLAHVVRHGL